jgi:hypothetical protein
MTKGTLTARDVAVSIGPTTLRIIWYNTSNSTKTGRSSSHSLATGDWFFLAFDSDGYAYLHDGTQLTTSGPATINTSGSFRTTAGTVNLGMYGPTNQSVSSVWDDGWGHLMFFDGDLSVAQVQEVGKYFTDRGWTF